MANAADEKQNSTCAGIHFGNTNSVISVYKEGKVSTVSNENGIRFTPTVVAYTGDEKLIGQPAKQYSIKNPHGCVTNIKNTIGQSFSDEHIQQIEERCTCQVINEQGTIHFKVSIEEKDVSVSPVKAASYVFTKLLENAEGIGGEDLEDTVIAVPKSFSEEQRIALCEAAESIGFNVLRIISEPAAAMLAYGIGQDDNTASCTCLVFRLGGTSMESSLVEVNSGMYRIVGEKSDPNFGSEQLDDLLLKHCCKEFKKKYKLDLTESRRSVNKLRSVIETCKIGLSAGQRTNICIDALFEGLDYNSNLTRAQFESMCSEYFQKCGRFIEEIMVENRVSPECIDKVILVGGGSLIPKVQQIFEGKFPGKVLSHISPIEVVAEGAAIQAGLLQGRDDIIISPRSGQLDCVSQNIGIQVVGEDGKSKLDIVLPKLTPIPTRRSRVFSVPAEQSVVVLKIYESSSEELSDSKLLGKLVLNSLPTDKSKEVVSSFEISSNGSLQVSLTESGSQKMEKISIEFQENT